MARLLARTSNVRITLDTDLLVGPIPKIDHVAAIATGCILIVMVVQVHTKFLTQDASGWADTHYSGHIGINRLDT